MVPKPYITKVALTAVLASLPAVYINGCRVRVAGEDRPLVRYKPVRGQLEFVTEYQENEQGTEANRRNSRTLLFEERLRVKTEGDVYHPDFLSYTAAVGLGLAQQEIDSDQVTDRENDTLDEYNFSGELLRQKKIHTAAHASKSETLIQRQFLGSLRSQRESLGGSITYNSKEWPMAFRYTSSETTQKGLAATIDEFFNRDDDRYQYRVSHSFSETSEASLELDRSEVSQETVGGTLDTNTDRMSFLHDLAFGKDNRHRLGSSFNYVDQSGTFGFKNLQWEERMRLQHKSNLSSNYDFRFINSNREGFDSTEMRGRAGFEHRLYESLITTGSLFASQTDLSSQGDIEQQGGNLGFSYRKSNPWGVLESSYNISQIRLQQSGGVGTGVVVGEPHVAQDLVPVELDRTNVDISTIVVRDATGQIYQEGDDYTILAPVNGRVRLRIIIVGAVTAPNLSAGQTFFVDYNFTAEPRRDEDTTRQSFAIRQRMDNGISTYYRFQKQEEDVSSATTSVAPDEYTINTIGMDFVRGGLFLMGEYSEEDSTLVPNKSRRIEGRYTWPICEDTQATLSALYHWLDFGAPDERDVELFRTGMELFSRLNDYIGVSLRIDYRDEQDSRFGPTRGFQLRSEVEYNYRQLSVATGAELSMLERRDDILNNILLYLRLVRYF